MLTCLGALHKLAALANATGFPLHDLSAAETRSGGRMRKQATYSADIAPGAFPPVLNAGAVIDFA
jgi:hypothetical protein